MLVPGGGGRGNGEGDVCACREAEEKSKREEGIDVDDPVESRDVDKRCWE